MTDQQNLLPDKTWAEERFWPNVEVAGEDDCWLWTGPTLGRGYGAIQPRKGAGRTGAHRFSYALHCGAWPKPGSVVMHSCDNPACVNPNHLSEGTQADNMQDCVSKKRHIPFRPEKKTHCKNGHEYTPENTQIVMSRGLQVRRCKTCKNEAQRRYRNGK